MNLNSGNNGYFKLRFEKTEKFKTFKYSIYKLKACEAENIEALYKISKTAIGRNELRLEL